MHPTQPFSLQACTGCMGRLKKCNFASLGPSPSPLSAAQGPILIDAVVQGPFPFAAVHPLVVVMMGLITHFKKS